MGGGQDEERQTEELGEGHKENSMTTKKGRKKLPWLSKASVIVFPNGNR